MIMMREIEQRQREKREEDEEMREKKSSLSRGPSYEVDGGQLSRKAL